MQRRHETYSLQGELTVPAKAGNTSSTLGPPPGEKEAGSLKALQGRRQVL